MWRGTKVRMTGDFSSEASAHQKTVEQSLESGKSKKKKKVTVNVQIHTQKLHLSKTKVEVRKIGRGW